MLKRIFTLTALLAVAFMLAPMPAVAAEAPVAATFSVELFGADADSLIDKLAGPALFCDLQTCLDDCDNARVQCFFSGTSFAVCMAQYNYCLDDCYWYCS